MDQRQYASRPRPRLSRRELLADALPERWGNALKREKPALLNRRAGWLASRADLAHRQQADAAVATRLRAVVPQPIITTTERQTGSGDPRNIPPVILPSKMIDRSAQVPFGFLKLFFGLALPACAQ